MSSSTPGINGRLHSEVEALCAFGFLAELRQTKREELSPGATAGGPRAHLEGWEVLGNAGKMWENAGKMWKSIDFICFCFLNTSRNIWKYDEI